MKYLIIIALLLVTFVNCDNKVHADITYTTYHTVQYFLNDRGETEVIHNIKVNIKDKFNGVKKITFKEPVSDINNLNLTVGNYNIFNDNNYVSVEFEDSVIGPYTLDIEYTYNTKTLFEKIGSTYLLNVPKIEKDDEIEGFDLKIYISKGFKINTHIQNINSDEKGDFIVLSKEDLRESGNTITLGEEMFYEVEIENVIDKNKNYIDTIPNIPGRQEVVISSISKKPTYSIIDKDKNVLFYYPFTKNTEVVKINYLVRIYGNKSPFLEKNTNYLTKPVKNWDHTKGLPNYYITNYDNKNKKTDQKAKDAYNYVINYLTYDDNKINYNFIDRIGAEKINENNNKNAVCLEYSDLLISFLRGLGVPAREVNGITVKKDVEQDISQLHSWVEYLNGNEWTQVDPTWEDTSNQNFFSNFDLYHINLLRRGDNSESPLLSGSYSSDKTPEKINVKILPEKIETHDLELKILPLNILTIVKNENPTYISSNKVSFKPYSISLVKSDKNDKNDIQRNFKFLNIKWKKALWIEMLPFPNNSTIIFLALSPIIFFIIHFILVRYKKDTKKRKKVRSII